MPFRYRFDWEFELLTPEDLWRLTMDATTATLRAVIACPDKSEGILELAAGGWKIIDRLYRIQHNIPMEA